MINEANAIVSHDEAAAIIAREWRKTFDYVARECRLPNGKIADVLAMSRNGDLYIAEVKHALRDSLLSEAFEKYQRYSNYLYLAVSGISCADLRQWAPLVAFPQPWHRVAIVGIYPHTMRVLRPPSYRQVGRFDAADAATYLRARAQR